MPRGRPSGPLLTIPCATCHAPIGTPCTTTTGKPKWQGHVDRRRAAGLKPLPSGNDRGHPERATKKIAGA